MTEKQLKFIKVMQSYGLATEISDNASVQEASKVISENIDMLREIQYEEMETANINEWALLNGYY
ncbi:MAG: hypothetical protein HUJ71_10170 [Pseudobutyrivibrio sp.]|nr:hypothetical protein [Pseudobutyrivibrio sp.]